MNRCTPLGPVPAQQLWRAHMHSNSASVSDFVCGRAKNGYSPFRCDLRERPAVLQRHSLRAYMKWFAHSEFVWATVPSICPMLQLLGFFVNFLAVTGHCTAELKAASPFPRVLHRPQIFSMITSQGLYCLQYCCELITDMLSIIFQ